MTLFHVILLSLLIFAMPACAIETGQIDASLDTLNAQIQALQADVKQLQTKGQMAEAPPVSLIIPGRPQSPHWDHILLSDFGRGHYWTSELSKAADRKWLAQHVDLVEGEGATVPYIEELRAVNPTLKVFRYALDQYQFVHQWGNTADVMSWHVSEPTTLAFAFRDVPGTSVTLKAGERMQVAAWNDAYHPFNLKDPAVRQWNIDRLLGPLDVEGLFLDAHGPDVATIFNVGGLTKVVSGGGIAEYGGRKLNDATLATDYQTDMVAWLTQLAAAAKAKGKFVLLNHASYTLTGSAWAQAVAANGSGTEFMLRPDAFAWPEQWADFVQLAKTITGAGGVVDAEGNWGYTWSMNRTAWNMWRLAAYYQLKEMPGSAGKVYLNLALTSNATLKPSADPSEWLPAYQVDVGKPAGPLYQAAAGTYGMTSDGVNPCRYVVYGRPYTKAVIFTRAKDAFGCGDQSTQPAATITLDQPMRVLSPDGTVSAPVMSIQVRNADSAILIK